jgi:phospholipase A-2-activating protein
VNASAPGERYDVAVFVESMGKWPEDLRFPCMSCGNGLFHQKQIADFGSPSTVIDICRALCVSSPAIANHTSAVGNIIQALLIACSWQDQWVASKARETNTMIAMRGIANLAGTRNGKAKLGSVDVGDVRGPAVD